MSTNNVAEVVLIRAAAEVVGVVLECRDGVVSLQQRRQRRSRHGRRRCVHVCQRTRHRPLVFARRRLLQPRRRRRIQAPDAQRPVVRHRIQLTVDHLCVRHTPVVRHVTGVIMYTPLRLEYEYDCNVIRALRCALPPVHHLQFSI